MLYGSSKSDVSRLETVARFTGVARDGDAGAALLAFTNRIWRMNTVPSRYLSDAMVATWLDNPALREDIPGLLSEGDQYRLLAWYCLMRPLDSGCLLSREPVDPILARLAGDMVAESANERLPYTALMMSIYHSRRDVRAAVPLRAVDGRAPFLGWYYSHGIRELDLVRHVTGDERAALNHIADGAAGEGLSTLCRFALEWLPHPDFDLASPEGSGKALAWFTDQANRAEPFATLRDEDQPATSTAGRRQPILPPGLRDRGDDGKHRLDWQAAEYFDRCGDGSRLLLAGQWWPAEQDHSWSRPPLASLAFRPPEPIGEGINLGILLRAGEDIVLHPDRRLTVFLNGAALWHGLVRDAARGELVLKPAAERVRPGAPNLLQFHVSEPPPSPDREEDSVIAAQGIALGRLSIGHGSEPPPPAACEKDEDTDIPARGIALRRLWIGQAGRGRRDAAPAPPPARGGERLLVLRGDLRSHTGYAKATRALAGLIPGRYRTIGVDIHPDPADHQAPVAFPIVPEAEALQQVIEQPRRVVVLHATPPDDFVVWPNARNVGWFFWETDAVPFLREWPLRLGLMDAIWAPSGFMAEFVRGAGYAGKLRQIAWPEEFAAPTGTADGAQHLLTNYFDALTDLRAPQRSRRLAELRGEARLLFLAVQSLSPRKGLPLLLSEWRSHLERTGGNDVLVLRLAFRHSAGIAGQDWQAVFLDALAAAGFRGGGKVRIALIPTPVSEAELTGLYRAADALLSMSFGEGFGGPIVEAIRNGCPVVAPRHTGLRDSIPEDYPLTVNSSRLTVALRGNLPSYPHSAAWHIPSPGALCERLEQFAAMAPAARQALVKQCRSHAMGFCWTPVVRQNLDAALDDLDLDSVARPAEPVALTVAALESGRHAAD